MQNASQPSASFIAQMRAARKRMSAARNKIFARLKSASTTFDMIDKYGENSTYTLEDMVSTNDDYMLIKKCFEETMSNVPKAQISKIYRVLIRDETSEQKSDNLMLFHGTTSKNAVGILEEGFKSSIQGKHGPGVYLTEFSSCAVNFAVEKIISIIFNNLLADINDNLTFIFVNEILESEKLEEIVVEKTVTGKTASPRKNRFEKYIRRGTAAMNSAATDEQDISGQDSNGKFIIVNLINYKINFMQTQRIFTFHFINCLFKYYYQPKLYNKLLCFL